MFYFNIIYSHFNTFELLVEKIEKKNPQPALKPKHY